MKQRHLQRSSGVSSPWQASFSTPWLTHYKEQKKIKNVSGFVWLFAPSFPPSSSLCLYMSEYPALLRRRIDSMGKTQIRAHMLQSLVQLVRSLSQRDAYNYPLKRSLINYSMTRRNKCCASFDGRSLYNALLLHCDGGQRILLSPRAWFARYENKSLRDLTVRVLNARLPWHGVPMQESFFTQRDLR